MSENLDLKVFEKSESILDSKIQNKIKALTPYMDLDEMNDSIYSTIDMLNIAYFALEEIDIQSKVSELRDALEKETLLSFFAVQNIQDDTRTIIDNTTKAYQYLLQANEKEALKHLSEIGECAASICEETLGLKNAFSCLSIQTADIQKSTIKVKNISANSLDKIKATISNYETNVDNAATAETEYARIAAESNKHFLEEVHSEAIAFERMKYKSFFRVFTIVISSIAALTGFGAIVGAGVIAAGVTSNTTSDDQATIDRHRAEAENYAKFRKEAEKSHLDAVKKRKEFATLVNSENNKKNAEEKKYEIFSYACMCLRSVTATMNTVYTFWSGINEYCKMLAGYPLAELVTEIDFEDAQMRIAEYKDPIFKDVLIDYVCGWCALNSICDGYLGNTKKTVEKFVFSTDKLLTGDDARKYSKLLAELLIQASSCSIAYQSHMQDFGWQDYVKNGDTSGDLGKERRLEAVRIKLNNAPEKATIMYSTHVQDYGWMPQVSDNRVAGSTGEARRCEAIKIAIEGLPDWSVTYRVYVEKRGWTNWAFDGAICGTTGESLRIEAFEVKLVKK